MFAIKQRADILTKGTNSELDAVSVVFGIYSTVGDFPDQNECCKRIGVPCIFVLLQTYKCIQIYVVTYKYTMTLCVIANINV